MNSLPTIERSTAVVYGHRLDDTTRRTRVQVPSGQALTVTVERELGSSWSTVVLEVKRVVAGASSSFATPKTIAAGGATVTLSSSEMSGVNELEVARTSGAAEASGTTATIRVSIETPVQPVAGEPQRLSRQATGLGDLPAPPSEG